MNALSTILRIVFAATVAALPASLSQAAIAATPQVAPAVFDGQSGSANVKAGQIFVVALPANRTTGYSWRAPKFDRSGVAIYVGTAYQTPGATRPGAGGTQLLILRGGAAGTATMTVNYARPWEKTAKPARSVTMKISVNGM